MLQLLSVGLNSPAAAIMLARVAAGLFFAISGYHKLFNPARHETVRQTMVNDVGPQLAPAFCWFIPAAEFAGGLALIVGFLTVPAAAGLMLILGGAIACEARERVAQYAPIDRADAVDDYLYLPEVLYLFPLVLLVCSGAGLLSLDSLLFH